MGLDEEEEEAPVKSKAGALGRVALSSSGVRKSTESIAAEEDSMSLEDSIADKRKSTRKSGSRNSAGDISSSSGSSSSSSSSSSGGRSRPSNLGEMSVIEQGGDTPDSIGTIQSSLGRTPTLSLRNGARGLVKSKAYESTNDEFGGGDDVYDGSEAGWNDDGFAGEVELR